MSCEESDKVPNQKLAQLRSAKSAVESAKETATGSPKASSIAETSSTWRSSTADGFRSDLTGKGTEIGSKFDTLIGNIESEISAEEQEPKVCPDDPRAERNNPGPMPI